MGETLADIGEGGLIALLRARITADEGVRIGLGDDTALVETSTLTLATADAMIEGVHFEIGLSSAAEVGYKALVTNVSDIAAMGGVSRYALVVLGAPEATPLPTAEALYDGLSEAASEFGVSLIGGDTVRAAQLLISVALLGSPGPSGTVVGRGGAQAGDFLCVTGTLGEAAAGLALLRLAAAGDEEAGRMLGAHPNLEAAHRRGKARAREGVLAASSGATAMIDISDGLARDARHIAEASGRGLEIDAAKLLLGRGVSEAAALLGRDPVELAVAGGEDYELAIATPAFEALASALSPTPLTIVGSFTSNADHVLIHDAQQIPLTHLGFDHFGGGGSQ